MFPHQNPIELGRLLDLDEPLVVPADEVVKLLEDQLSARRRERIESVIAGRTVSVVPVMEGIHDLGNVAAVLRSAEGLGYQVAHVIDTQSQHKQSQRITQGADKWMDVIRWQAPGPCVAALRDQGYRVAATDLEADVELGQLDFEVPTALVFGNELEGVSPSVLEAADVRTKIPIPGFVQSFNISVAAALSLYEARRQRFGGLGAAGDLDEEQRQILRAHFYIRASNRPRRLVPSLWHRR